MFLFTRMSIHFTAVGPNKQKYHYNRLLRWFIAQAAQLNRHQQIWTYSSFHHHTSKIQPGWGRQIRPHASPGIVQQVVKFPQNRTSECFIILHTIENTNSTLSMISTVMLSKHWDRRSRNRNTKNNYFPGWLYKKSCLFMKDHTIQWSLHTELTVIEISFCIPSRYFRLFKTKGCEARLHWVVIRDHAA